MPALPPKPRWPTAGTSSRVFRSLKVKTWSPRPCLLDMELFSCDEAPALAALSKMVCREDSSKIPPPPKVPLSSRHRPSADMCELAEGMLAFRREGKLKTVGFANPGPCGVTTVPVCRIWIGLDTEATLPWRSTDSGTPSTKTESSSPRGDRNSDLKKSCRVLPVMPRTRPPTTQQ